MQSLRQLYEANLEQLVQFANQFPNEGLSRPLLMQPLAYFNQPTKLFIVGQETYGWNCEHASVDALLEKYTEFNMGEKYYSTPFWNVTRKVESVLGIEKYSCAWSNLNRFDQDQGPPTEKILEAVSKLDFLVREEIRILKPDICLFYTNRKYDQRIETLFPGVQFHNIEVLPECHFTRLIHDALPKLTFRTPHPKTIRMQGWEEAFLKFLGSLSSNS